MTNQQYKTRDAPMITKNQYKLLYEWVVDNFPVSIDMVLNDLIDVATYKRPGNKFEKRIIKQILGR